MKHILIVLISITLSFAAGAQTSFPKGMPTCYGPDQKPLEISNTIVMKLKTTTPNLYKQQVFVKAQLISVGQVQNNKYGKHMRFIVSLAEKGQTVTHENLIEISQSMNGYLAPTAADLAGPLYVCGEYSTTDINKLPPITDFEPSTTGAMIHWTHAAGPDITTPSRAHPHGWVFANGKIFGTNLR